MTWTRPQPTLHTRETIQLAALADDRGLLADHHFRDCRLLGPAILFLKQVPEPDGQPSVVMQGLSLEIPPGDLDSALWVMSERRVSSGFRGAIIVERVTIERCSCDGRIAFAGNRRQLDVIRYAMLGGDVAPGTLN